MATPKQIAAAKQNIKKAQEAWRTMTSRQHSLAQPEGRSRAKPGTKGEGDYYRIILRPKEEFVTFRFQDVGERGHLQRLAGKRTSGSWSTHAWLISKADARVEGGKIVSDNADVNQLLRTLRTKPEHVKGDIWKAKDRRNVPEREKPTAAQQHAWSENIKKAQAARHRAG